MPRKTSAVTNRPIRSNLFDSTAETASEADQGSGTANLQPADRPARSKRTYYLPDTLLDQLDELQLAERRRTGVKPELSDLVTEAVQQLVDQRLSPSSL